MKKYQIILMTCSLTLVCCKSQPNQNSSSPEQMVNDNTKTFALNNYSIEVNSLDESAELFIFPKNTKKDTLSHFSFSGSLSESVIEDINHDGYKDALLEFSGNRSCNFIVFTNQTNYVIIDSCGKFNNLTHVKISEDDYYATYENNGCASGLWTTKLLRFNEMNVNIQYEAIIDQCDSNIVELRKYSENRILETSRLNANMLNEANRDLNMIWNLLVSM